MWSIMQHIIKPKRNVPEEFNDYLKVMEMGAEKHGDMNWLEPNGTKSSHKDMHDSMFHHLAKSFAASPYTGSSQSKSFDKSMDRKDSESNLDHLLHLICRAQMEYTRIRRHIRHEDDCAD